MIEKHVPPKVQSILFTQPFSICLYPCGILLEPFVWICCCNPLVCCPEFWWQIFIQIPVNTTFACTGVAFILTGVTFVFGAAVGSAFIFFVALVILGLLLVPFYLLLVITGPISAELILLTALPLVLSYFIIVNIAVGF